MSRFAMSKFATEADRERAIIACLESAEAGWRNCSAACAEQQTKAERLERELAGMREANRLEFDGRNAAIRRSVELDAENAALREAARRAAHAANKQGAENLTQELRDAVIALEAALAQSPPTNSGGFVPTPRRMTEREALLDAAANAAHARGSGSGTQAEYEFQAGMDDAEREQKPGFSGPGGLRCYGEAGCIRATACMDTGTCAMNPSLQRGD
jgi:hypothetical protein